jgi:hypothetical protein
LILLLPDSRPGLNKFRPFGAGHRGDQKKATRDNHRMKTRCDGRIPSRFAPRNDKQDTSQEPAPLYCIAHIASRRVPTSFDPAISTYSSSLKLTLIVVSTSVALPFRM